MKTNFILRNPKEKVNGGEKPRSRAKVKEESAKAKFSTKTLEKSLTEIDETLKALEKKHDIRETKERRES